MSSITHHQRSDHSIGDRQTASQGTRRTRSRESVELCGPDDTHPFPGYRFNGVSQTNGNDRFGSALALGTSGRTTLVGAREGNGVAMDTGALYVSTPQQRERADWDT